MLAYRSRRPLLHARIRVELLVGVVRLIPVDIIVHHGLLVVRVVSSIRVVLLLLLLRHAVLVLHLIWLPVPHVDL
ncbi:hypothetical protein PMAYCL1PPCAC_31889, partial [Pristionchus mayeri]